MPFSSKYFLATLVAVTLCMAAKAQTRVRFGNEDSDTITITKILDKADGVRFNSPEERVAFFAQMFIDTPYAAHTLETDGDEILTVRLDSLDCTTFVETALALAYTNGENRHSWRDFIYNLRRLRYRAGEVNGYPSRLHYIADWAVDNIHRGNIRDATRDFPRYNEIRRTLDFMSQNREKYPALADSANFDKIRQIENGYRQHLFPYIKTIDLNRKDVKEHLRSGDVVAMVSNLKNLDVTHLGIVLKDKNGIPRVLHASSSHNKVEITTLPIDEFLKKNRQWIGVRIFRLKE